MEKDYEDDGPKEGQRVDVESARDTSNVEFNLASGSDQLERGLKSRHIQFLALGE